MAKKKKPITPQRQTEPNSGATLKDLLSPEMASKLKAQSEAWKAEEAEAQAAKRRQAEEERQAREKQLEQNFEHLLNHSKQDWRNFK
ncbi:YqkE family protein [Paenibacillus daejeonensis]|uniref:YqkE family protein n=1 Tax=Paenibacillus daejeonensis TaxID=135193 RepID=UPI000370DDEE|nr:YqkE family protein [Paenibacillus daejeonensis]